MAKRQLSATEMFDLRQALHVATLEALISSRRWEPGDLVFQGGTSLHLAHGSPRYSEDLDFLVNSTLKLDTINATIQARLENTGWLPQGTKLTVSKSRDEHNPYSFIVSIGGPDVIGAVRVKVELWQTNCEALNEVKYEVAPVRLSIGPAAGMQAFVPTAELQEIYADKVFALGARPYLKPRDVFDLHWLTTQCPINPCTEKDMQVRLATYPNETPNAWLEKAEDRQAELATSQAAIMTDLKRWLPPSWPLHETAVAQMITTSVQSLEQGMDLMREIALEMGESPRLR